MEEPHERPKTAWFPDNPPDGHGVHLIFGITDPKSPLETLWNEKITRELAEAAMIDWELATGDGFLPETLGQYDMTVTRNQSSNELVTQKVWAALFKERNPPKNPKIRKFRQN